MAVYWGKIKKVLGTKIWGASLLCAFGLSIAFSTLLSTALSAACRSLHANEIQQDYGPTSEEKLFILNTLTKLNETFDLKLDLIIADFPASDCGMSIQGDRLTICRKFIDNLHHSELKEDLKPALGFLIAHEIAHVLIDPLDADLSDFKNMGHTLLGQPGMILTSRSLPHAIQHLAHENNDALAAKLVHWMGLPIEGGLYYLKNMVELTPSLHAYVLPYTDKIIEGRIDATKRSFKEGWSGWSNYRKIYPVCGEGRLREFAKENSYTRFLKAIGEARCIPFATKTSDSAILEGLKRYGLTAK